jgi:hypothetical protein
LRSLGIGELLDTTFALYRRNFTLLAGIAAVLGVPQALINIFILYIMPRTFYTINPSEPTLSQSFTVRTSDILRAAELVAISGVIGFVFGVIVTATLAYAVSSRYLGRTTSIWDAYRAVGLLKFAKLLAATILGTLFAAALFLGSLAVLGVGLYSLLSTNAIWLAPLALLMIPVLVTYLYTSLIFVPQTVVIEGAGILQALARSWQLVRGYRWRVARIFATLTLLGYILSFATVALLVRALATGLSGGGLASSAAVGAVVNVLVQPLQLGGLTLLYYDLRIRKEGFDLEQLALALDGEQGALNAVPHSTLAPDNGE